MLEETVVLEPYEDPRIFSDSEHSSHLVRDDAKIMIPGINSDGTLYPIEKIEAHIRGVHHLAVSVFIFDGKELLIQRRARSKYHCGGQWANSCCTHPNWNEDAKSAAVRRLKEELGFSVPVEQRLIVEYSADVGNNLWEKERVHMFRADASRADVDRMCELNPDEVSEIRWITAASLRLDISQNPSHYTPWFRIYLSHFPELDF